MFKFRMIPGGSRFLASRVLLLIGALHLCVAATFADEVTDEFAALVLSAEEALQEGDYAEAARLYLEAARGSDNIEVAKQATRIAYSYGFSELALEAAERWRTLDAEDDESLLYVAQLHLRLGHLRDARRHFEELLEQSDEDVDERLLALIPVLARENEEHAYEVMRQLARPYGDSPYAHYAVAVLALQAGEVEVAIERAEAAIELDEEWLKPKLVYARALLLSGEEDEAIDYTSRLIGDDPDPDPEARLELAVMLVTVGRDDDALSQVNQILLEQPYRSDALRLMAIINFRLERLDASRSDFEDLLTTGNYRMEAHYYLGRIADLKDDPDEAVRQYAQVIAGENAVAAQTRAAVILSRNGDTDGALQHLERFSELNPTYAVDMLRARAQLLTSLERYDEALELFDRVTEFRPENEGVYLGRAELLLRMGRVDDAISQYRAAVKRWPDSAMSLNALGYTLTDRTDRHREAERLIRKALRLDPDSPAIIDSWGWVQYRLGNHDEALEYLEKAYESLRDPEVAGHIVEVLWSLERRDEAVQRLEEAEQDFPESEYLQDVRERLLPVAD